VDGRAQDLRLLLRGHKSQVDGKPVAQARPGQAVVQVVVVGRAAQVQQHGLQPPPHHQADGKHLAVLAAEVVVAAGDHLHHLGKDDNET
jgi:hypothetical protein